MAAFVCMVRHHFFWPAWHWSAMHQTLFNQCDRSNPGRLRRAWQAASPRRFKHRNLVGRRIVGGYPGKMMSGKLNQWAPPNLFLELQAPDMVISTNLWYIYIYICMYWEGESIWNDMYTNLLSNKYIYIWVFKCHVCIWMYYIINIYNS